MIRSGTSTHGIDSEEMDLRGEAKHALGCANGSRGPRWRGLAFGAVLLALIVSPTSDADNFNFRRFGPGLLNVAMFSALVACSERLSRLGRADPGCWWADLTARSRRDDPRAVRGDRADRAGPLGGGKRSTCPGGPGG